MNSQQDSQPQPSTTNEMASSGNNYMNPGATQHFHHGTQHFNNGTQHFYNGCCATNANASAAAVPTCSPNEPSSQPAEEGNSDVEYDDYQRVYLPQAMFATFSERKGNNSDGDSGDRKKNQPSKAQLKVAEEFFPYYKLLDRKQYQSSCTVDKNTESVHQFACLLLSLVGGLEIQAMQEYERVAIQSINMLANSSFPPLTPLRNLCEIQVFLQAARLKMQSSPSFDPLVPLQILLSVYRLNEEASDFVKQTLPNLINTYGSMNNPTWMNFSIKIIDGRQNHSLVTHLNNKCRYLKRLVHIAEQRVFAMHTRVRMPKNCQDHHVYPWTEHSGGTKKAKKVYIVIPKSLSADAPKSIEDVKAILQPARQQPLPPEHWQSSGLESEFLDMVKDLIRNQYSRDRLVELIDQQFEVSDANENDIMNNNGQLFGLSNGANHGLNLTNEGEVDRDLSDLIDDFIANMDESDPVNGNNSDNTNAATAAGNRMDESGPVDGSNSDTDNTNVASTAAGDFFDSSFANEVEEKDQRQQEAEERANNQNSPTQENEQAEESNNNADDNGVYEVKDYLSYGNRRVFVEWSERREGEWGRERFGWIAQEDVQEGLSVFMKNYTPLKEEVPIDSITQK